MIKTIINWWRPRTKDILKSKVHVASTDKHKIVGELYHTPEDRPIARISRVVHSPPSCPKSKSPPSPSPPSKA